MDSKAYIVNKAYVFRFPKRQEVGDNLQKEIVLLPYLQRLPLAVPDFKYTAYDPATGWPFAGYPLLKGEAWTPGRFILLPAGTQQTGLQLIGRFLTALHAFDVDLALRLGIREIDVRMDYQETYEDLKNELYPDLPSAQRRIIDARFNTYLNDAALFPASRALVHNDLSTDHILCDPVSGLPQGIIDFGDVAVNDPDVDLKCLYEEMGPYFIQQLLRQGHYQSNLPEAYLLKKLAFYRFCEAVRDTVQQYRDDKKLVAAALHVLFASQTWHKND